MKRTRNKRFITLLELLIVLAILSLAGGIAAFNLRSFFLKQRALSSMDRVLNKLRVTQEVMLLLDANIEIRFIEERGAFSMEWVPTGVLTPAVSNLMGQRKEALPELTEILFEDAFKDSVLRENFSLKFLSRGFLMNRGVLTLKADRLERYILLPGYVWPLQLLVQKPHSLQTPALEMWILESIETVRKETS